VTGRLAGSLSGPLSGRVLAVRLDSVGDVLLTGPALRAVAAGCDELVLLAGPRGASAARLLPDVDQVLVWRCPWIDPEPPPVRGAELDGLVDHLRSLELDAAVIFTSFHQAPLPTALLLRWAGVGWIGAISDDYPGSLLDLRHRMGGGDPPEAERSLSLAAAAGRALPTGDDGRLAVRAPTPDVADRARDLLGSLAPGGYVVVHPGTSVPARAWPAQRHAETVALLAAEGWPVVVTGGPGEEALTSAVAGAVGLDLGGRTDLALLAVVLAGAAAVVVGNTGPAHLAAAVRTPVVSLFAPTVPAQRWGPYGVPVEMLGDQQAACRATRAAVCPVPGHPCLTSVPASAAVAAVRRLATTGQPDQLEVTR
jgi:ADP-heptose:LPS heptosyltransferase